MSVEFVTPNDLGIMAESDSVSIQNAVNYAKGNGIRTVVIPRKNLRTNKGQWDIDKTILLPSHITIVLDNCYIRTMDGAFCNVFRNENFGEKNSLTMEGEQCDIVVKGEGYSILDGGTPNDTIEGENWELKFDDLGGEIGKLGVRINSLINFHNVKDFVLDNFEVRNQRWHAISLLYCNDGKITDITINAKNNIQNQDGINIKQGCNNLVIERINGQSGDDFIAMNALECNDSEYFVEEKSADIHDIKVKDIIGCSTENAVVILRNQDDLKLYNVDIENLLESDLEDKNNHPYATLNIGQNGYFKTKESVVGNTKNINVKTVISDNAATVEISATLCDSTLKNIRCLGNRYAIITFGVKMKNVVFDKVYIEKRKQQMPPRMGRVSYTGNPIEFEVYQRDDGYLDNVVFKNADSEFGQFNVVVKAHEKNNIVVDGKKI